MVDIYNQFKDFKAFEVVFTDENSQPHKLLCNVKSIENDRILLDSNNEDNSNVFAEVGDDLQLHIYTENGIYSAISHVISMTKGLVITEYVIAYPVNSKHSQRREYFRAEIKLAFVLVGYKNDNHTEPDFVIDGETKNICGKGMSYISDKSFPEYDKLDLELIFNEKRVKTTATLVYSKRIIIDNHPKFIHAFTFTSISQSNIDFIVKKCFLHQLELRKRKIS